MNASLFSDVEVVGMGVAEVAEVAVAAAEEEVALDVDRCCCW